MVAALQSLQEDQSPGTHTYIHRFSGGVGFTVSLMILGVGGWVGGENFVVENMVN